MDYRFLGTTGLRVSQLCFGTMSFAREANSGESAALYARARAAGINFFDCANVYSNGEAEEILGRLIGDERDGLVIATKAYFPTSDNVNARGSTRYHLRQAVEASLRRLGTDRIDIFYLHRFDDATDLEDTLRSVEDLVRAGKILYPAVSNFSAWQAMKALGIARARGWTPMAAFQPMYNLLKRQVESEILPMCASEGLAVVPYSATAGGVLSGKYSGGIPAAAARLAEQKMYAVRYGDPRNFAIADRLGELAREHGVHPVALAVAWVDSHPAVTSTLIGARSVAQLEQSLAAVDIDLSDWRDDVTSLSPAPPPATDRNEETSAHNFGAR